MASNKRIRPYHSMLNIFEILKKFHLNWEEKSL